MTEKKRNSSNLWQFIRRLHFYIGLFVGPFILIAALTGTLYVLTPQVEQWLYKTELTTQSSANEQAQPLSAQIAAARKTLPHPLQIKSVRPAPSEGETTRILFNDPEIDRYRARTVFVDPVTLDIRGELASYGTSGILPFRTAIDFMHTDLLLGPVGRYYSELAASWMWVAALGGIVLWWQQRRSFSSNVKVQKNSANNLQKNKSAGFVKARSNHAKTAIWISLGLIFFSATGLTWSKWAGGNISEWRNQIGWVTPAVSRQLPTTQTEQTHHNMSHAMGGEHAEHMNMGGGVDEIIHRAALDLSVDPFFDGVEKAARDFGIDAGKIEIVPVYQPNSAWEVREIDRSWPTQVDAVAVDPVTDKVVDHANFADFPIVAKLIRWGIDAHMGVLFGLPNQLILAAFGIALCAVIIWGYRMWWMRRAMSQNRTETLTESWLKLSPAMRITVVACGVFFGFALPMMGCSLLVFCVFDVIRWKAQGYKTQTV